MIKGNLGANSNQCHCVYHLVHEELEDITKFASDALIGIVSKTKLFSPYISSLHTIHILHGENHLLLEKEFIKHRCYIKIR